MAEPISAPQLILHNATLHVSVLSAKDLPAMDSNGKSDPYVRVGLCPLFTNDLPPKLEPKASFSTSVVKKNLNPTWNEKFEIKTETLRRAIKFEVWDEDRFSDDFIGFALLNTDVILANEAKKSSNKAYVDWVAEQEKAQGGKRSALDYVELQKRLSDFKFETTLKLQGVNKKKTDVVDITGTLNVRIMVKVAPALEECVAYQKAEIARFEAATGKKY